jgi:hypothetical protein
VTRSAILIIWSRPCFQAAEHNLYKKGTVNGIYLFEPRCKERIRLALFLEHKTRQERDDLFGFETR